MAIRYWMGLLKIKQIWTCRAYSRSHLHKESLRWRHTERDGVSNHQAHGCLLNRLFRRRLNKTSMIRFTGLCEENSHRRPVNSPHKSSNAENVSIWWRHHGYRLYIVSALIKVIAEMDYQTMCYCHWRLGAAKISPGHKYMTDSLHILH